MECLNKSCGCSVENECITSARQCTLRKLNKEPLEKEKAVINHMEGMKEMKNRAVAVSLNYKEEYNKLKKENEELKETFNKKQNRWKNNKQLLEKEIERIMEITTEDRNSQNERIFELTKENEKLIEERKDLLKQHENQRLNIKDEMEDNKKLKEEIFLPEIDIKKLKGSYESLMCQYEEGQQKLKKFKIIESELTELKKLNNQGYMEQMNTNIKEKDKQLEALHTTVKEYYDKNIEMGKERDKATDLNRILKDKVEALKESVISLTELI